MGRLIRDGPYGMTHSEAFIIDFYWIKHLSESIEESD
jgi:hypothetical protein